MNENDELSIETIINNAQDYRNELVTEIEGKIAELNNLLEQVQKESYEPINKYIRNAKQYDVNFIPDKEIAKKVSFWAENFIIMKQKLVSLELDQEKIFEQEKYIQKAQEALDLVDESIEKEKAINEESNRDAFEEACRKKRETEIELSNLDVELRRLEAEKQSMVENNSRIEKKTKRITPNFIKRRRESEIESNSEIISEINKQIETIKNEIEKLKIIEKANHFVQSVNEDLDNKTADEEIEVRE